MAGLELPPEMILNGLDWSPTDDRLAGALTEESGTGLWLWNAQGALLGPLVEIPNPNEEILSAQNPAWSPDGSQVAFELRRWYWWGGNTYKTELMVVSADGKDLHPLVETDWGMHATAPSWSSDGGTVYYQLSTGAPEDDFQSKMDGNIWSIDLPDSEPVHWTEGGASYLPAAHP